MVDATRLYDTCCYVAPNDDRLFLGRRTAEAMGEASHFVLDGIGWILGCILLSLEDVNLPSSVISDTS